MTGYIKAYQDRMRNMAMGWLGVDDYVIELGCSSGNFAGELEGCDIGGYLGIDIQTDKIEQAKKDHPNMNFVCCNILDNLHMIKRAKTFVSFQCLEHIKEDLKIIQTLPEGCRVIISVPNRPYPGHVRWFELDGWGNRFSPYIEIAETVTIQHPKKENNRAFLFRGIRNGYKN